MRLLSFILFLCLATPVWGQPVLSITDARKPNPVAPYVHVLEDFTHKLTYEQVSRFSLDSFQLLKQKEVVQLAYRRGTVWLRFALSNKTNDDLFLISSYRRYKRVDVFTSDSDGKQTHSRNGYDLPLFNQPVSVNPPVIPLGRHPEQVFVKILIRDSCGDYLHIGDMSQALKYQKRTTRWQSLALGAFLIVFLYALVFFLRLRDPLLGWYALLMFSIILFYLDFYDFLSDYVDYSFWRLYMPTSFFYLLCWSLFHLKFLNLRHYSKPLYWLLISINALFWLDYPIYVIVTTATGSYFSLLYELLYWLGIDWSGLVLIVLFLLLTSLIYVGLKNFRRVFLYTIAFLISLVAMIISLFAVYNIEWLPHYPYNNLFVPGTLIEIVILGYILGERANEHRRQQNRTQQQLIVQLQENLRQKAKLLQIRDEIARDLHDEVGATLTSIAISTKLVQKKVGPEQTEITPILQQIQTDSQDTIHTIRDAVWALNPDNDAPEKLLERMRAVGYQMLANQDISLTFANSLALDELPPFSMEQRRNLYFVYKESLHNIVKHARATRVEVLIFRPANELCIRIVDNGNGFEPTQTNDGNGLKNFQKRASEGGFSVSVCSAPGRGTRVEMHIRVQQTTHIGDGAGPN